MRKPFGIPGVDLNKHAARTICELRQGPRRPVFHDDGGSGAAKGARRGSTSIHAATRLRLKERLHAGLELRPVVQPLEPHRHRHAILVVPRKVYRNAMSVLALEKMARRPEHHHHVGLSPSVVFIVLTRRPVGHGPGCSGAPVTRVEWVRRVAFRIVPDVDQRIWA